MNKEGFTLIEMIFSLMICSLSITLIYSGLSVLPSLLKENEMIQDEIGLSQIRHIGLLGEGITVNMDGLEMIYLGNEITIHQRGERLVKEPGFHILLQDVISSEFIQDGHCFYLRYKKSEGSNEKKRFITCT